MLAAGIDVLLPVYWGDPGNAARWSVPGLHLMAQVEQGAAQAGQTVPGHAPGQCRGALGWRRWPLEDVGECPSLNASQDSP
jgi:hypothetical protein